MKALKDSNDYESMVVLSSQCKETELKDIAFSYAQQLKRLGASGATCLAAASGAIRLNATSSIEVLI